MSTIDLTAPYRDRTMKAQGDLIVTALTAAKADIVLLEDNSRGTAGTALGDTSPTIVLSAGKWRTLPAATLTTNRTVTLGTTGAVAGDQFTITRLDATANTLAIVNGGAGAGTLVTLPASKVNFAVCQFDGTNWALRQVGTQ